MDFKKYPKGDARRYFVVLKSIDCLKEKATLYYVAKDVSATRAEVQRSINVLSDQFGVVVQKAGAVFSISSYGVLKKHDVFRLISAEPVPIDNTHMFA